ncbi:MAG: DUF2274 domain-containing protein [Parvularculaceae bacterium]
MTLKLAKIADRTPVKLTLALDPDLHARLGDYARLYQEAYGDAARIEDLAPVMLQKFLDGDRHFRRARRTQAKSTKGD